MATHNLCLVQPRDSTGLLAIAQRQPAGTPSSPEVPETELTTPGSGGPQQACGSYPRWFLLSFR
jgi:hypothetical protein